MVIDDGRMLDQGMRRNDDDTEKGVGIAVMTGFWNLAWNSCFTKVTSDPSAQIGYFATLFEYILYDYIIYTRH